MIKRHLQFLLACVATLVLATGGCSKKTNSSASPGQADAFASASPNLKAAWEKATAAAATNDYATAIITFRELQVQADLTPEQRNAVNAAMTAANNQMLDAVQKGDPKAKAALQEVRKSWTHR